MRRLPAVVAALLLPTASPVLLVTTAFTGALLVSQPPARAQSAEAVAKVAQAITVRIEGATLGSGVLVMRDGNRYTVLTAWHVVTGQRPEEELDIYTPDGQRHQLEQGSIKRLGEVDLAVLTFTSSGSYEVAPVGDVKSVSSGSSIYVSGFPLPTSAVPTRIFRFMKGDLIANATVAIPDGYQLLYDNQTLPGMSGGAVLNAQGQLVGIHGKAEKADQISESSGKLVATSTNQGVPISYYNQYAAGAAVVVASTQASKADDYSAQAKALLDKRREQPPLPPPPMVPDSSGAPRLSQSLMERYQQAVRLDQAKSLLGKRGSEQEVIRLANQVLAMRQSADAYFYRAYAKVDLGDKQGAIADYTQAIAINPRGAQAWSRRGDARHALGDKQGAIADYNKAIAINPLLIMTIFNRAIAKSALGDEQGALVDYNHLIAINPQDPVFYSQRANSRSELGDKLGACSDFKKSASLGRESVAEWLQSDGGAWCRNMP